jgi:hypothetical protein
VPTQRVGIHRARVFLPRAGVFTLQKVNTFAYQGEEVALEFAMAYMGVENALVKRMFHRRRRPGCEWVRENATDQAPKQDSGR